MYCVMCGDKSAGGYCKQCYPHRWDWVAASYKTPLTLDGCCKAKMRWLEDEIRGFKVLYNVTMTGLTVKTRAPAR